jgi:alkylhydroperoxidase family enzyme
MQQGLTEEFYAAVAGWRETTLLTEAERVAVEYAELFAVDHLGIGDDLLARLMEHWSPAEILDLTVCIGRHLAFGRLTAVLAIDLACPIHPGHQNGLHRHAG